MRFFLVVAFFLMVTPALAQRADVIGDEAAFRAGAKAYHAIPFNNPALEYDIWLPKDWTVDIPAGNEGAAEQKILRDAAIFKSPFFGTEQATVTIQYVRLVRDISAESWLKGYLLAGGVTTQEKIAAPSPQRAATAFLSVAEARSVYSAITVEMNGNVLMLARFDIPLWMKDDFGFLQKRVTSSFRMITTDERPVEEPQAFVLADALKFSHPPSWVISDTDLRDSDNLSVQVNNQSDARRLKGMIRLVAVRRRDVNSFMGEAEKLRAYISDALGLDISSLASSSDIKLNNRFTFARQEIYPATARKGTSARQEVRLIALADRRWYVFLFLVTPAEDQNLDVWAHNTRVFDLVAQSLR